MLCSDFQSPIGYHAEQIPEAKFLHVGYSLKEKAKWETICEANTPMKFELRIDSATLSLRRHTIPKYYTAIEKMTVLWLLA